MYKKKTLMPPAFWTWYEEHRHALKLTDRGVALKAKISHSVISKARNGLVPIGYEALAKIALAFDTPVSVAYRLAGYLEEPGALSPFKMLLLTELDTLSAEDQDEVLAFVQLKAQRSRAKKAKK